MDRMRPKSVTIISWYLIIVGVLCVYGMNSVQFRIDYATRGILVAIEQLSRVFLSLIPGIAMLKGFNWGRIIYLWGTGIFIFSGIIFNGFSPLVLPGIVIYLILFIFLTRPMVSEFFRS